MGAAEWTDGSLGRENVAGTAVQLRGSDGAVPVSSRGVRQVLNATVKPQDCMCLLRGAGRGGRAIGRTSEWPNRRPECGVQAGRSSTGGGSLQR